MIIYHIANKHEWQTQQGNSHYNHATISTEGFIHCCEKEQISGVLERYFKEQDNLVLLEINTDQIKSPLKFELGPTGESFPHIYGKIEMKAISVTNIDETLKP